MSTEAKTYKSAKRVFKIKSPLGGFIEFTGGSFTTDNPKLISHLDKIVEDEPHRGIRVAGVDEPPSPGQNLPMRQRQIVEWQLANSTRNPEDSVSQQNVPLSPMSSKEAKPVSTGGVRFTTDEQKAAVELLKQKMSPQSK